ncbi:MAG: ATP synthase F0 sector subunit a [Pseudolabrys sp.]|jgi:F-type H+-transporting ATPase subunit a|nr:ATP synthase F0 sector subunit a [Pseudolabrys sp.]
MDPIHQFQVQNLIPLGKLGNASIAFTNSAAFMLAAVVLLTVFLLGATTRKAAVPSRLQSAAELTYEFVADMLCSTAGKEGMRFFPFVFTLFMFVLTLNLFGLIPYAFSVTSHIIITAALALTVFLIVLTYGLVRHGLHFFNLFVPKGVPILILPMIVAIEILSFVSRPISHSVRLFANMLAGHIALQVFAGFIILLGTTLGAIGWVGGVLPFAMIVALLALELLVAFLQAYVFAILTCIYLNDAIHPGH